MLDSVRDLADGVKHFSFVREDGGRLEYTPGQFVQMFFDDGETFRRSYSIASIPGREETVDMAISAVVDGRATRQFWAMRPGDKVEAKGPFGKLVLREEPVPRYVLVATGTGITPYRAMLPELARRLEGGTGEVRVLYGTRTREDLLYADDFVEFDRAHPGFHYAAHYSRGMPSDRRPWEREGYVQHAFEDLGLDPDSDVVFLCGNPNMIDEAFAWLTERGFGSQRIRREKYIS